MKTNYRKQIEIVSDLIKCGKFNEAKKIIDLLESYHGKNDYHFFMMAKLYLETREYNLAYECIISAISQNSIRNEFNYLKGKIEYFQCDYGSAILEIQKALQDQKGMSSDEINYYECLVLLCQFNLGDFSTCEKSVDSSLKTWPEDPLLNMIKARLLNLKGNYQEASNILSPQICKIDDVYLKGFAHYILAYSYLKLNKIQKFQSAIYQSSKLDNRFGAALFLCLINK